MKRSVRILSILVAGILLVLPVYAQSGQGIVSGTVVGRDGMPLAGAIIYIDRMNMQNPQQRLVAQRFDTKTGKNGSYSVNGLPPGFYEVSVLEGGRPVMKIGDKEGDIINVSDGRDSRANFDLTKAPPPSAAGAAGGPPLSAADLAKERAKMEADAANKTNRDKAFKAGGDAYKAKDYEEAVKQFQIVAQLDPKQDVAFANLGNSLHALKRDDEAAAAYQKAIELKPKEVGYYNNLGLALGGAKKLDEAKAAFETAVTMDPMKAGDYLFNEGAMYNNNGDYPKAIEAFKRTLVADPNNKGALLQEAISYFGSPDTMAQAEPLLQKFLTLNPSPSDAQMAKDFIEAIHTQAPTEFKSEKAIADEKAKAAKDAAAAQKGKAPAAPNKTKQ